ncbi:Uncharacterised protein [Shigella sonnei]|nr:Uncharacterised protein [Shigella sonnei]CSQ82293.1 Uncharacterised protein [Shigella sonnei]
MPRQRCHPAGIAAPCPKHSGNVNQGFHLRNINQRHQFVFITMGKEIIKQTWLTRFYQFRHRNSGVHISHRIVGVAMFNSIRFG